MTTKQALIEAIEQLPEQHLNSVLKYVQHLCETLKSTSPTKQNVTTDPLADFIGAIDRGSLAANLDKDLYDS